MIFNANEKRPSFFLNVSEVVIGFISSVGNQQGIKVTATSAVIEGVVDGGLLLIEHIQQGKRVRDLDKHEWSEIGIVATKGVVKGAVRGAATYSATNFLNVPAPVATAGVTAAFGIGKEVKSLLNGDTTEKQFGYAVSEIMADTAVSAISTELGKRLIPIPVVGPLVGNAIGMFVWGGGKRCFHRISDNLLQPKALKVS